MEFVINEGLSLTHLVLYQGGTLTQCFQLNGTHFHIELEVIPVFVLSQHYLTIRPVARKGYGSITHEAKPNGLLIRGL